MPRFARRAVGHVKGFKNVNSILKMHHLQKLAIWASEASIPSLAALFGHHLASSAGNMGILLDSSLFPCQRCEIALLPGVNCTIRIEKNTAKVRHPKTFRMMTQNNVVYTCHFCSNQNLKRGTPKGHMKEIFSGRAEPISESKPDNSKDRKSAISQKYVETRGEVIISKPLPISESNSNGRTVDLATKEISIQNSPVTPVKRTEIFLSKKSGFSSNKPVETDSNYAAMETGKNSGGSRKRRRKAWSSLKRIAEGGDHENKQNIHNLSIPVFI
ncbi:uncharacterized protein LOC143877480 [Tasmannia lanceolata]|uniref:uncharacterized protein LOC143877480 n=1 Tax=Tasmannia lanceolata TaxID=3420 RepID=UPI0040646A59